MVTIVPIERGGSQLAQAERSLAAVLKSWMARERLRPHQVADAAGISRPHVWLISKGRIARPTPETIRKLAIAVATDPYGGHVDETKREAALRELSVAAGYNDLVDQPETDAFLREIRRRGANPQSADFWDRLIAEHPSPSPTVQQLIRALMHVHDRPGAEDLRGMLVGGAYVPVHPTPENIAAFDAFLCALATRQLKPTP